MRVPSVSESEVTDCLRELLVLSSTRGALASLKGLLVVQPKGEGS